MRGRISRVVGAVNEPARTTREGWLRRSKTPVGRAKRARTILLVAGECDAMWLTGWAWPSAMSVHGRDGSGTRASSDSTTSHDQAASPFFPEVTVHAVNMACERPDDRDRSLCQ